MSKANGKIRAMLFFAATLSAYASTFEVASIKRAQTDITERSLTQNPGARLTTSNATVKMLIMFAYQLMPDQISGGPGWLESDGFDIDARGADSNVSQAQFRQMIQSLLMDRFQLKVHSATEERPIFVLVQARNGTKLVEAKDDASEASMRIEGRGRLTGLKATMSMLAATLAKPLQHEVVDETGLKGTYSFKLQFVPEQKAPRPIDSDAAPASDGPSIFVALEEQLGLSLKASHGPVQVMVIDHAERPTPN